jgi:hypothetical protein
MWVKAYAKTNHCMHVVFIPIKIVDLIFQKPKDYIWDLANKEIHQMLKTIEIRKVNFVEAIYLQTFKGLLGYELIDPYPFFPKPKTKRRKELHAFQELVDLEGRSLESITKPIDLL